MLIALLPNLQAKARKHLTAQCSEVEIKRKQLFVDADAFVLPTKQEKFGIVLVEALAAGTPVKTTDKTDIWRELKEGGAKITDGSVEQISTAINEVLEMSPSARSELGARGHQYVSQWLNPDVVVKQYEAMYEACLRNK